MDQDLINKMLSTSKPPKGGGESPSYSPPSSSRARKALELAWQAAQNKDKDSFIDALDAAIEIRTLQSK